jgi:hypothetical protein
MHIYYLLCILLHPVLVTYLQCASSTQRVLVDMHYTCAVFDMIMHLHTCCVLCCIHYIQVVYLQGASANVELSSRYPKNNLFRVDSRR